MASAGGLIELTSVDVAASSIRSQSGRVHLYFPNASFGRSCHGLAGGAKMLPCSRRTSNPLHAEDLSLTLSVSAVLLDDYLDLMRQSAQQTHLVPDPPRFPGVVVGKRVTVEHEADEFCFARNQHYPLKPLEFVYRTITPRTTVVHVHRRGYLSTFSGSEIVNRTRNVRIEMPAMKPKTESQP